MAEPVATSILGLKAATLLGGFLGSVVSLSFIAALSPMGKVAAVITGTVTAGYVTPVVTSYFPMGSAVENGIGFLLGLTSMNLIPVAIRASSWLQDHVGDILSRRILGKGDDQ